MKFRHFIFGLLTLFLAYFLSGAEVGIMGGLPGFMMISIVCTMGIGLVVWVPGLILLGYVVEVLYKLIFKKKIVSNSKEGDVNNKIDAVSVNKEILAVIGYIVSCRNTGTMNDEFIRLKLKSGGWGDKDIDDAFKNCTPKS